MDRTGENEISVVQGRLKGLLSVLEYMNMRGDIRTNPRGLPYLMLYLDEDGWRSEDGDGSLSDILPDKYIRLTYLPVSYPAGESFMLEISGIIRHLKTERVQADADNIIRGCFAFNLRSSFGYAVFSPREGIIELRAQSFEKGRAADASSYEAILGLFLQSADELSDLIKRT